MIFLWTKIGADPWRSSLRAGRVVVAHDVDPKSMLNGDEFVNDIPLCASCELWLYGWRVRGRIVQEECLCLRGKFIEG